MLSHVRTRFVGARCPWGCPGVKEQQTLTIWCGTFTIRVLNINVNLIVYSPATMFLLDWGWDVFHRMYFGSCSDAQSAVLFVPFGPQAERQTGSNTHMHTHTYPQPKVEPRMCALADLPRKSPNTIRLLCISDTHELHESVRAANLDISADLLVHTGDIMLCNRRFSHAYSKAKLLRFVSWLATVPAVHKIFIGGNHDRILESLGAPAVRSMLPADICYLDNDGACVGGLRIWGSGFSRGDSENQAFQAQSLTNAPRGVDVLLTHGPLRESELKDLQPLLHVSGHIHARHGVRVCGPTVCISCAILDSRYRPSQPAIVVDLPSRAGASAETGSDYWQPARV
jgi:predicted phosphodiesterase